jgi:hypothetical protein
MTKNADVPQARQPHVEQQRDAEAEQQVRGDEPHGEDGGHDEGVAAAGLEHALVVGQAGEREVGAEDVALVEAPLDHHDQRHDGEQDREAEHRQHERVCGAPVAGPPAN